MHLIEKEYTMATARKTRSGKWRIQFFTYDEFGTKTRRSFTANTRWEAERMADKYVEETLAARNRITVGKAVSEYIELKRNVLSPATIRGYEIIRKNRLQSVMDIELSELTSLDMQKAINEDAATRSTKTILDSKNLIVAAAKLYGVRLDLNVTLPPKKPKIKDLPTAEQVIQMIRGTDIELPCMLAMWLSLRVSEVRGLQFSDLKDGVLTVQRSKLYLECTDVVREVNKTYKSTRRLELPTYLQEMIQVIPHTSDDDFIISQSYQVIRKHFKKLAAANGYDMTFHDLRHLNASIMLMLGIPDKYAMERGGWSTNSTLKNVYQHTFSEERKQVDKKIDDYFNGILRVE